MENIENFISDIFFQEKCLANLSKEAKDKIKGWNNHKRPIERIGWNDLFILISYIIAERSIDGRTKHGSVIVNDSHEIVATGFNGFLREIDDSILPNFGNEKYKYILHSEMCAIIDCARQGKSTLNSTIFITGAPCLNCLLAIAHAGIKKIIHSNRKSIMNDTLEYKIDREILDFLMKDKITIKKWELNKNILLNLLNKFKEE